MKRQPTEWEKIFVSHISNKRLMSKLYKELMQLNSEKKKTKKETNFNQSNWWIKWTFFPKSVQHTNSQQLL